MGEGSESQMKAKKDKLMRVIAIAALVLLSINFAYTLIAYAAPGLFHLNNPDFAFAYDPATFGTTYVSDACSFNTMSIVGTGSLFDFSNFYWDSSHATWPRFGFGCDTLGQHMNITLITTNMVHIEPSAVGVFGRLWAPDMAGIASVTGAASWNWNIAWHVVTVESAWFSPEIVVTFTPKPTVQISTNIVDAARLLAAFLAPIMILIAITHPENWKVIVEIGFAIAVLMALSIFVAGL